MKLYVCICVCVWQDIDLMCVDNAMAVTASLDGDVRVWDLHPMKRRCVRVLSRR